ncbi:uncharacterized protein LOC117893163 [Drosophila subobscura]|uniref:uncharacterized protein LOC117893163 n=1 Tax=Drosophila subobscura TaxID=7241 RepID=UPI00155A0F3D|nr:uncharacterized protein LOC117893163 [Drosophila subobscura]
METQRNITDLPLEVLDLIFNNIDIRMDKIQLAQAHEYLGEAFAYHSRDTYKRMSICSFSPLNSYALLLKTCGSTVRELSYDVGSEDLGKLVGKYCHHLESIDFRVTASSAHLMESLILLLKGRDSIKSIRINMERDVPGTVLQGLTEFPQLRKLDFRQHAGDAVYEIRNLINLEELKIQSKSYHEQVNIFEICAPLKKLRCLTVFNINILSHGEEDAPLMPCPALEELTLQQCLLSAELPHFPKLTSMTLASCDCNINNLVCASILKNANSLEDLDIDCHPSPFDGDSFLEVLRACKKLREFCEPIRKVPIYRAYVFKIVEILRENGWTPESPFTLWVFDRPKMKWIKRLVAQSSCPGIIDLNVVKFN